MRAAALLMPFAVAVAACFRHAGHTPPHVPPTPVVVSDELREPCALPDDAEGAPRFQYRSWTLQTGSGETLQRLARCLVSGPRKGARVRVTARGEGLDLARERARAVKAYLVQLGVAREDVVEAPLTEGAGVRIELAGEP